MNSKEGELNILKKKKTTKNLLNKINACIQYFLYNYPICHVFVVNLTRISNRKYVVYHQSNTET